MSELYSDAYFFADFFHVYSFRTNCLPLCAICFIFFLLFIVHNMAFFIASESFVGTNRPVFMWWMISGFPLVFVAITGHSHASASIMTFGSPSDIVGRISTSVAE